MNRLLTHLCCLSLLSCAVRAQSYGTDEYAQVVHTWSKRASRLTPLLQERMVALLAEDAMKNPDAYPLRTLAPGSIYYALAKMRQTPDVIIDMNEKSAPALMDYFVNVCVHCTNVVPPLSQQCADIFFVSLDSNFYRLGFWHYLELCKQTNNAYVSDYYELLALFGFGMHEHWVFGDDTNMMQALLDTARVAFDNEMLMHGDELRAGESVGRMYLKPRRFELSTRYVPFEMVAAAVKGPGQPAFKRLLLNYLTEYIHRDAYNVYCTEGAKYFTGRDADRFKYWAEQFLEKVKKAEERARLIHRNGSDESMRTQGAADYAAAIDRIQRLRAQATTTKTGLAYWMAVKELDGHARTWAAADLPYTQDVFLELATNCNGSLIKDVLKEEIANTSNYVERAEHVPVAAMILLGMYLDPADVPWLVKYVNAARPVPRPLYDDDEKYMVDIARQIAFLRMMEVAYTHKRHAALQAYADMLPAVRDRKVRDEARTWLAQHGIAAKALPARAPVKYYHQAPATGLTTSTNAPPWR